MADQIIAIVAVLGLLGALITVWVGVKTDVAVLQATVNSLDRQLVLVLRSQLRLERTLLGHPIPRAEDNGGV
jgi:hypothetical protein